MASTPLVSNSSVQSSVYFFFSSRRRHTRCYRDWSSDVCSSDLHDASDLWGMRVFAVTQKLGQNNNKRNVLCIGPAGENLSRIASIMNDRERALARGGPGAVMGSKNLKAIVVEGKDRPAINDPERFKFLLYETRKLLAASPLTRNLK